MGDSDAEWVGVDFEFGQPDPPTTTRKPARPRTRRPPTFTERPVPVPRPDAPEVEGPPKDLAHSSSVTVISSAAGGILGVALILLVIYMLVLRRRLNKAKVASADSQYQLRVEDVAHLTHLDETSNTYVNTTDLQKLLTTVKAKSKAQEKPPPTMPKVVHQTPTPYRATSVAIPPLTRGSSDNNGYASDPDVVILRAPMPLPHGNSLDDSSKLEDNWGSRTSTETEALYSNLEQTEPFKLAKPPSRKKLEAPADAPPPPPAKQRDAAGDGHNSDKSEPTSTPIIARPAPPPPKLAKTKSCESLDPLNSNVPQVLGNSKPIPPVAPKPGKNAQSAATDLESENPLPAPLKVLKPIPPTSKPTPITGSKPTPPVMSKPTPPVMNKPTPPVTSKPIFPAAKPGPPTPSKPGVTQKGKGLPPLKMALIPSLNKTSGDSCTTPDTGIIELTPENTPTGSISSKIAFLEGKMKTPILPTRAKY